METLEERNFIEQLKVPVFLEAGLLIKTMWDTQSKWEKIISASSKIFRQEQTCKFSCQ